MAIEQQNPKPATKIRRRILRSILLLGSVYSFALMLLFVFQRSLIFHPRQVDAIAAPGEELPEFDLQPVSVPDGEGGKLNGWLMTGGGGPSNSEATRERPFILYFCGNAGNRSDRIHEFRRLACCKADILCCDYRGYGDNPGSPSEAGLASNAQTVWKFAVAELNVPRERIVLFGESLGGGVATRLASELSLNRTPPAALIVRSSFTSLPDVAADVVPWAPVRCLMTDRFPSIERMPHVTCPLLVLHGRRDTVVPWELGKKLFDSAPERSSGGIPKHMITFAEADHNNIPAIAGEAYDEALSGFLNKALRH